MKTLALLALCAACVPARCGDETAPEARLICFEDNEQWGFKDAQGRVVIPAQYDEAGQFSCGLAPVNTGAASVYVGPMRRRMGGRWGYINARNEMIVPQKYDDAQDFSEGLARIHDASGFSYIDTTGKVVIVLGRVNCGNFNNGLAPVYVDSSRAKKDWQTKYINKKGETVFTIEGYGKEFSEGLAIVSLRPELEKEQRLDGFIDTAGKMAITPQYDEAKQFREGLAPVRFGKTTVWGMGDRWGYIDKTGKLVIAAEFNETYFFRNGVALVHVGGTLHEMMDAPPYWKGGEWRFIDKQGNVLKRSKEWMSYEAFERERNPNVLKE